MGGSPSELLDRPADDHASVEHAERHRIGALDGLRAVAVVAVIAYHLWPDTIRGGFLGVDLFMVLSGFLITALLVGRDGRRARLGAFWARRFRRLVPALLGVLIGVAAWLHVSDPAGVASTVRGQGLASLLYVGNWKLIHDGTSYAALAGSPSPLLHLWSLSIEEQFYALWPLLVAGVLIVRPRLSTLAAIAGGFAVVSAALMATWYEPHHDPLRLYFGTDTRAFAFLIGAIAFIAMREREVQRAGILALSAIVIAFVLADSNDLLYQGGFAVFAVAAAMVVVAATQRGPVARVLDRAPLRLVGRVSYGIYLWHWPVIVLVTADTSPFSGVVLLAVRLALISALTAASWLVVEQPYRRASAGRAVLVAIFGVVVTALLLITLPRRSSLAYADVDVSAPTAPLVVSPASIPAAAAVPHTVMIVGDSGMYDLTPALVAGFGAAGSTVVATAFAGDALTRPPGIRDSWADTIAQHQPDLIVVMLGAWDYDFVTDNGDTAYAQVIDDTLATFTAKGAHVLWISALPGPAVVPGKRVPATELNRFYSTLPSTHPGAVDYVDITAALAHQVGVQLRKPDQWHLCPDGAAAVAHEVLTRYGIEDTAWRTGPWRDDTRYDDPPGGCPTR